MQAAPGDQAAGGRRSHHLLGQAGQVGGDVRAGDRLVPLVSPGQVRMAGGDGRDLGAGACGRPRALGQGSAIPTAHSMPLPLTSLPTSHHRSGAATTIGCEWLSPGSRKRTRTAPDDIQRLRPFQCPIAGSHNIQRKSRDIQRYIDVL